MHLVAFNYKKNVQQVGVECYVCLPLGRKTGYWVREKSLSTWFISKARTESVTFVNTNIRICSVIPDSSTAFIIFEYPCFMDDVSASLRGDATVPSAS